MELCPIRGVNFGQAIIKNDPDAIGRFLADDWIIIDPDGGVIDKSSFLRVIRSGTLSHQVMDSDDVKVRIYGDAAAVTALTTTKGKYMGQEFTSQERATDMFVKKDGRWQCVVSQRPVALGRKNWLHIGSPQAGPKVAAILSIVESCRRLQVPVRDYFSTILPGLGDLPIRCLPDLTPAVWVARHS